MDNWKQRSLKEQARERARAHDTENNRWRAPEVRFKEAFKEVASEHKDTSDRVRSRARFLDQASSINSVLGVIVVGGVVVGGAYLLFGSSDAKAAPAPAPAPPPRPAAATMPEGAKLKVTTPKGQPGVLRAAAGKTSAQVALVPHGSVVTVTGAAVTVGGYRWYPVATDRGQRGFMHGDILGGVS